MKKYITILSIITVAMAIVLANGLLTKSVADKNVNAAGPCVQRELVQLTGCLEACHRIIDLYEVGTCEQACIDDFHLDIDDNCLPKIVPPKAE